MFFENQYRDNQPIGNVRGMPIYLTTIIVAVIVVGLVFSTLGGLNTAFALFAFDPDSVWHHGQIWRLISYLAVDQVSFFTIFNLLFLYGFGRDCEKEMGRGRYAAFLGILVVAPALIATILWLAGIDGAVTGSTHLAIGLVIAFAAIYPNVLWWNTIPMKFVAMGCMFLAAVGHLSRNDQVGLGGTLATCAVSFGYIRGIRAGLFSGFSWTALLRRKPKPRVIPPPVQTRKSTPSDADALLDKIAKSGLQSLTAKEKLRLQAAREELLKRNQK
jgi:membrane associated rhomboid family serine protease